MRPAFFIAVFALTSIAAPINKDQPSDRDVGLDQARHMEARNAEPYIRDHAGNKREAARTKQGANHRKAVGRRAEDVDTKSDVKRGYTRGQQKRDDNSVDDVELDARAIRDRQRSVDTEAKRSYTRGQQKRDDDSVDDVELDARAIRDRQRSVDTEVKRSYTRGQQKRDHDSDDEIDVEPRAIRDRQRSVEDDDVEARAIRDRQRSVEDDDVEARAIRDRQRSVEDDDVEARAIRDRQRSVENDDVEARAIRDRQRSLEEDDDVEVDNEEFEEVVARAIKNANTYKPTSGGFWKRGERSADPETINRSGNSQRGEDAEAESISDLAARAPQRFTRVGHDKREPVNHAGNFKRDPQTNCGKRSADPVFRCNGKI